MIDDNELVDMFSLFHTFQCLIEYNIKFVNEISLKG